MARGFWKHSAPGLTARATKRVINSLSGNQSYFSVFKDWKFGDWLDRQSPITNQQSVKSSDWVSMPVCGESGTFGYHPRLRFSHGTFLFSQCSFNLACRIPEWAHGLQTWLYWPWNNLPRKSIESYHFAFLYGLVSVIVEDASTNTTLEKWERLLVSGCLKVLWVKTKHLDTMRI